MSLVRVLCLHKHKGMDTTMEPLSPHVRRLYLYASIVLFMILLPLVIFYADGWRYKRGFGLVRTGGIFISVPYTGAQVTLNSEPIGESGFLERSFYVDNLAPSSYIIKVERDGSRPWERLLVVEPQLVTDARALLLPTELQVLMIATSTTASDETVREVSLATLRSYEQAFSATSTLATSTASSTVPVDESDGIGLFIRDGDLFAVWMEKEALPPSIFCGRPSFCNPEITIERSEGEVNHAFFYNRGIVFSTKEGGVFFVEPDIRPTALNIKLFTGKKAEVRLLGEALIVKDGSTLYEVAGL